MHRVLPPTRAAPLFGAAQTRLIEERAMAVLPPHTLMHRAGSAVAHLALAIAPHARRIWVAAGPGNNGGDGLDAAIALQAWGKQVEVTLVAASSSPPADASDALARAQAAGVRITAANPPGMLEAHDIAIDALLGIGAARAPDGGVAMLIGHLNALACPVLAVDLPSGLNARNGQALGDACVRATHTLSLLTLKPGLFTGSGRDFAGELWFDALGLSSAADVPDAWLAAGADTADATQRRHAQHKGSFGDVAVVGGDQGMVGAALLAARAAHAAGAGRTYVSLLADGPPAASHDPFRPELMFRPAWWSGPPAVLARTTVVCGCGGGQAVRAALPRLLSLAARLVLDADALNAIAADAALQTLLRARLGRQLPTVLTPHPLEAARLLECTTQEVQNDRLSAAQTLADRLCSVVVLKGSGSVIAAPGQAPHINATGNAALASAGTGDVLAGWLGGRWAQAPSGDALQVAFTTALQAVAAHGAAAEPMHPGALRAADLVERLHRKLQGEN